MTIDRRHLLGSLAAAAVCAPAVSAPRAENAAASTRASHNSQLSEGWFLARQCRQQQPDHAVDFWTRPFCNISHTQYLPTEIVRGAMWYDAFDAPDCRTPDAIDRSFQHYRVDWPAGQRRYLACSLGVDALSSALRSLTKREASHSTARTALLSLDSLSPLREPSWAEVLPAFRSCYERIVGHFHLERRGLRQWRECLNANFPAGYFQEFFTDAAAQCDAVILTSAGLCESDVRCDPRASSEELAGQLMRDLGCALLTPAVLERIVGAGAHAAGRKPRLFALASLRLWTMDDYYIHSHVLTDRQRGLVLGSFGEGIPTERELMVVTAVEDLHSDCVDEIRQMAHGSFFTTTVPACKVDVNEYSILNYLRMITFWPFECD